MKIAFGTAVYEQAWIWQSEFIQSVNAQTQSEFDLIIMNDGLDQEKINLLTRNSIHTCHIYDVKPKTSISKARMELLKIAKQKGYELLVLGDFDDTFSKNRVKKIVDIWNPEIAFYYHNLHYETCEKEIFAHLPEKVYDINQILEQNFLGLSNTAINLSLLSNQFLDSLEEVKTNVFDWYLYSKILITGNIGLKVDEAYTVYRQQENNLAGIQRDDCISIAREITVKKEQYRLLSKELDIVEDLKKQYENLEKSSIDKIVGYLNKNNKMYWWSNLKIKENKEKKMFKFDEIKNYGRPYVIAEIGANHNGDIVLAKEMIDKAKECGADCVKFQSWSKDSIFSKIVYKDNFFLRDDYRNRTDYTLEQIVDKYSIGKKEHLELKKYCDEIGIDFASTGFCKEEIDFLVDELDVPFIKVASMDVNNIPFLKHIASKKKPVVISTGLCELYDVVSAIKCLESNGCSEIVILHCVSIYPPKDEEVNLNNIEMYKKVFDYPIGYSDHTLGSVAPIMSLTMGVCMLEKHFTLDKNMVGWDHKISADPEDLKTICDAAKCGYKMLGTYNKVVSEDEERRNAFQRSIVAARDIYEGEVIQEADIDYKRPGTGIPPKYYEFVVGKTAKRDIAYDEIIQMSDF